MAGKIVVLAGGVSSRMRKATRTVLDARVDADAQSKPKAMIGVGEGFRPFLDYLLVNISRAGYDDVMIVVGENDASIRDRYGRLDRGNMFEGLAVGYGVQRIPRGRTKPLGTADALLCAMTARPDWRGQKVTVCNSDNLYSVDALREVREVRSPGALIDYDRSALLFDQERIAQFAVVIVNEHGSLVDIVEKPSGEELLRARRADGRVGVSMNIFSFGYELILPFLEEVPLHPVRQEKEIPEAVRLLVHQHPGCMLALPRSEHVPDLTSRDDIERVQEEIRSLRVRD